MRYYAITEGPRVVFGMSNVSDEDKPATYTEITPAQHAKYTEDPEQEWEMKNGKITKKDRPKPEPGPNTHDRFKELERRVSLLEKKGVREIPEPTPSPKKKAAT